MGPVTIFDKSALQALNTDEAVWFEALFLATVVPVVYVETLADLEKEVGHRLVLFERRPERARTRARRARGATDYRHGVVMRWLSAGKPPLDWFAPDSTHVFKVELLFYLGIHHSFISGERASNKADMAYLYYLPFAMVFVSGDGLHHRTAPLFLRANQSYLRTDELKAALRQLDEYYDRLPEKIKELGVLRFASWPPSDVDNAVTALWDKHMRPDRREIARGREAELQKPRDREADHETVAALNRRLEEARPAVGEQARFGKDGPDAFFRRHVPATKGKWRIVTKEVEEAEGED